MIIFINEVQDMKKILSVLIAVMMTVSVLAISSVAVAAPSPSGVVVANPSLCVNGVPNDTDVSYTPDAADPTIITFKYTGEGTLKGWETNLEDLGYVEGTDFTLTENADGSLTVKFISAAALADFNNGDVIVDAIVDFDVEPAEENGSNKSPSTGIATAAIAGSIAVAGAGFAVLSATKKRDAE